MMKKLSFLILIIFSVSLCFGQNEKIIEGTIYDSENQAPLSDVLVFFHFGGIEETFSSGGKFQFPNVTLDKTDPYSRYTFTFYKPGYKKKTIHEKLPLEDVLLEKSVAGFIQVMDKETNSFIPTIQVKHQYGRSQKTDNFGFAEMQIPPGAPNNRIFRVSVHGGKFYRDTAISFTASKLKSDIIILKLSSKKISYQDLKKEFNTELDEFWRSLEMLDPKIQDKHLDNCFSILTKMIDTPKNQTEQADFLFISKYYNRVLEDLYGINKYNPELEILTKNYLKSARHFNDKHAEYLTTPHLYKNLQKDIEPLLILAFSSLKISLERALIYKNGYRLVESDIIEVSKLFEHIKFKRDNPPSGFTNHKFFQQELDLFLKDKKKELDNILRNR